MSEACSIQRCLPHKVLFLWGTFSFLLAALTKPSAKTETYLVPLLDLLGRCQGDTGDQEPGGSEF